MISACKPQSTETTAAAEALSTDRAEPLGAGSPTPPDTLPTIEQCDTLPPAHSHTEADHCTSDGGDAAPAELEEAGRLEAVAETEASARFEHEHDVKGALRRLTFREQLAEVGLGQFLARRGHTLTPAELGEALGSRVRGLGWRQGRIAHGAGLAAVYRRWGKAGPVLHVELPVHDAADFAFALGIEARALELQNDAERLEGSARSPGLTVGFVGLGKGERLAPLSWGALPPWARDIASPLSNQETAAAMHRARRGELRGRAVLVCAEPALSPRRADLQRERIAELARAAGACGVELETLELLDPAPTLACESIVYAGDPEVAEVATYFNREAVAASCTLGPALSQPILPGELAAILPRLAVHGFRDVATGLEGEIHDSDDGDHADDAEFGVAAIVEAPPHRREAAREAATRALAQTGNVFQVWRAIVWGGEGGAW